MPSLIKPATALAALLLAVPTVASCGGDNSADPALSGASDATPSAPESQDAVSESASAEALTNTDFGAPAKGAKVEGKRYSYRIPTSWKAITKDAREVQKNIDTAAGEAQFSDGFQDSVNVTFDKTAAGTTQEELAASVPDQLDKLVKKLDVRANVVIDGVEFIHYRGRLVNGASKYFLDQFVSIDESGRITIVTFSFSPDLAVKPRQKVVDSVLATWAWAS